MRGADAAKKSEGRQASGMSPSLPSAVPVYRFSLSRGIDGGPICASAPPFPSSRRFSAFPFPPSLLGTLRSRGKKVESNICKIGAFSLWIITGKSTRLQVIWYLLGARRAGHVSRTPHDFRPARIPTRACSLLRRRHNPE
ncbi:hypothetical protein Mapa_014089 [Marchantia paleacea]|nr:hypothetical protein Mapa_014089 [Marchantia paleacea]